MVKISIIIVCYNGEKYIDRCIYNLKKQDYDNYEIVFIDDGSTDNTEKIVKKYNNIVKYYKADHMGIAYARNLGIEKSSGNYFMFVDIDDYLDETCLRKLSNLTNDKPDLIKYGYKIISEENEIIKEIKEERIEKISGENLFTILCRKKEPFEMTCVYLYNKKYWLKNKFMYKEGHFHEDFGLTPLVIVKAKNVKVTNESFYGYVQSSNSITRNKNKEKIKKMAYDYLEHYKFLLQSIKNVKVSEKTKEIFKSYISNAVISKLSLLEKKEKRKYAFEIKKYKIYDNLETKTIFQKFKKVLIKIKVNIYSLMEKNDE